MTEEIETGLAKAFELFNPATRDALIGIGVTVDPETCEVTFSDDITEEAADIFARGLATATIRIPYVIGGYIKAVTKKWGRDKRLEAIDKMAAWAGWTHAYTESWAQTMENSTPEIRGQLKSPSQVRELIQSGAKGVATQKKVIKRAKEIAESTGKSTVGKREIREAAQEIVASEATPQEERPAKIWRPLVITIGSHSFEVSEFKPKEESKTDFETRAEREILKNVSEGLKQYLSDAHRQKVAQQKAAVVADKRKVAAERREIQNDERKKKLMGRLTVLRDGGEKVEALIQPALDKAGLEVKWPFKVADLSAAQYLPVFRVLNAIKLPKPEREKPVREKKAKKKASSKKTGAGSNVTKFPKPKDAKKKEQAAE